MSLLRVSFCQPINGEKRLFRNSAVTENAQQPTARSPPTMGQQSEVWPRGQVFWVKCAAPCASAAVGRGPVISALALQGPHRPAQVPGVCVIGIN